MNYEKLITILLGDTYPPGGNTYQMPDGSKVQFSDLPSPAKLFFDGMTCNSFRDYGFSLVHEDGAYTRAKEIFKGLNQGSPCWEDVILQIVLTEEVRFIDQECDGEYTKVVNLDTINENYMSAFEKNAETLFPILMEHASGDGDGVTTDSLLQIALYGDIIFG